MKKLIFWIFATLLIAVTSHVATLLYVQLTQHSKAIAQISENTPANQLMQFETQTLNFAALPHASPDISYSYCSFDISERPLRIRISLPSTFWSMTAYTQNGVNFYTIMDRQIETKNLELVVARENHKSQLEAGTAIVTSPTNTGLFVFRAFIPNRSLTEVIQQQMKEASCTPL